MPGTLNVGGHDIITHSGDAGAGDVTVNVQNRLVLDSSGNVGIGTSSPTGELHIKNSNPAFRIESTSSGNMQFGQWDGSNNRIQSSSRPFQLITTDSQPITLYTNNTERILIDPNGDVKINALNASADVVTDGSGYLTTSSDARLKNEIGLITESGIEVIKQIIPKYFSWKEDENNKQHLGFFAQDIHPVLPEAAPRALKYTEVGRDENDEPILEQVLDENGDPDYQWGLATQPIVAMCVKAIQDQQTLIESQQSQIDALTTRIEALENA